MLSPNKITRRSFLGACGATMLPPTLHSSPAAMAHPSAGLPDKKLVIMYIPNGIVRRQFSKVKGEAELLAFIGGFNADKSKEQRRYKNEPVFTTSSGRPRCSRSRSGRAKDVTDDHRIRSDIQKRARRSRAGCLVLPHQPSPVQLEEQGIRHPERPHAGPVDRRHGRLQDGAQHARDWLQIRLSRAEGADRVRQHRVRPQQDSAFDGDRASLHDRCSRTACAHM